MTCYVSTGPDRAVRDHEIAYLFRNGASRNELALRFGLTPRRIGQIARARGAYHATDQLARLHEASKLKAGRPRLVIPEEQQELYVKARRYYGAAFARELIGLAA